MTRWQLREWLVKQVSQIVMTDPVWNGGIAETRKIAALAETFGIPLVLHNVAGPICHAACMHLGAHIPNLFYVESARAFYREVFPALSELSPAVADGCIWIFQRDRAWASSCWIRLWSGLISFAKSPRARGWLAEGGLWATTGRWKKSAEAPFASPVQYHKLKNIRIRVRMQRSRRLPGADAGAGRV